MMLNKQATHNKKNFQILSFESLVKALSIFAFLFGVWMRLAPRSSSPSLYWEEVALGYDAYSLLQTGKDHHGNSWPLVALESFGDWKPTGYVYALLPFIKIFGLSDTAIRLPSALAGVMLILISYFFANELIFVFKIENTHKRLLPWITAAVLALSPWAVIFSSAAWEVNLAVMLTLSGVTALFNSLRTQKVYVAFISAFLFLCASYTYHAHRVVAPSLMVLTIAFFWMQDHNLKNAVIYHFGKGDEDSKHKNFAGLKIPEFLVASLHQFKHTVSFRKKVDENAIQSTIKNSLVISVLTLSFVILGLLPLLFQLKSPIIAQRFRETSIFSSLEPIEQSNQLIEKAGSTHLAKVIYHRYVFFFRKILSQFFAHFSIDFLFVHGDSNPRHSSGIGGQLYMLDALLIVFGLLYLKKNNTFLAYIMFWMVISVLPASISTAAPHALRTLTIVPIFSVLIAAGILHVFSITKSVAVSQNYFSKKKLFIFIVFLLSLIYLVQVLQFWRFYSKVYPKLYAQEWQDGYQEMITILQKFKTVPTYSSFLVSREYGRPAMYYWFYSKTDPREVQNFSHNAQYDQGEFLNFENIEFSSALDKTADGQLLVTSLEQKNIIAPDSAVFAEVKNSQGKVVWVFYER